MKHMREKTGGFFAEFRKFIARGNVMDMAVGVIIGGAFKSIADSLTADIKGANAAGLKSIWFNPTGKPLTEDSVPTHQARSYSDILNILDAAA